MNQAKPEDCTHIAIPKDQAQLMFAYLSKQPFELVNGFMGSHGVQLVKIEAPKLVPVETTGTEVESN